MANIKSQKAFSASITLMNDQTPFKQLYMWTFTFAEVIGLKEAMRRWNKFCNAGGTARSLTTCFPAFGGLRVLERHPGKDKLFPHLSHGFHFHLATPDYLQIDVVRSLWTRLAGGGRIHVLQIPKEKAYYLGKYLAKQRGDWAMKGVRQWAAVGNCDKVSARDIIVQSHWVECYKFLNIAVSNFGQLPWNNRLYLTTRFSIGCNLEEDLRRFGYQGIIPSIPEELQDEIE